MSKKDQKFVIRVVKKVLQDVDVKEVAHDVVVEAVKDEVIDSLEEAPPAVDWIRLVELDEAESHKNKNGDFLAN